MAKQIKSFSETQLTAGVRVSFHESVRKLIEKYTPAALRIETQVTVYLDKIEEAQELIRRPTAYASTLILRTDDDLRDRLVGTVSGVIRAHLNSPIEAKAKAANTLSANTAPYKDIQRHQYQQETAEIDGMNRVLDEYAEEVAALHLEEEAAALKEANENFKLKFEAKAEEEKARQDNKEVDTYKKLGEVRAVYDEIVQVVNAYAIVQPSDELEGFIDDVNARINLYSNMEGGSSSGKTETDEKPSGEEPKPETPGEDTETPGGEQTTPTEPDEGTEEPQPGVDNDGDGSPEVV